MLAVICVLLGALVGYCVAIVLHDGAPPLDAKRASGGERGAAGEALKSGTGPAVADSKPVAVRTVQDRDPVPANDDDAPEPIAPVGSLRERIARALADLPPVEKLQGEGVITGKVTEAETGAPAVGVLIQALGRRESNPSNMRRPPTRFEPPSDSELVRSILNSADRALDSHSLIYHTHTDANGNYTLKGLAPVIYRVSARSADYEFRYAPPPGGREHLDGNALDGMEINFVGTRRYMVEIEVSMPDGSPAIGVELSRATVPPGVDREGARLNANSYSFRTEFSWGGPGSGRYMPPGWHVIRVTPKAEHGLVACDDALIEVGPGLSNRVEMQMRAVPGLVVSIRDESGRVDLPNLRYVQAMPWTGDKPPTKQQLQTHRNLGKGSLATEPQSVYGLNRSALLRDLAPGRHVVVATERQEIVAHAFVEVSRGQQELTLVISPPKAEDYIKLWVRAPDGTLFSAGVEYELRAGWGSRIQSTSGSAEKMTDGSYSIFHFEPTNLHDRGQTGTASTEIAWTLSVSHGTFGMQTVSVDREHTREVTIRFEAPSTLTLEVPGMAAHPARARITATIRRSIPGDINSASEQEVRGEPTSTGFVFRPVQPGRFEVVLSIWFEERGYKHIGSELLTLASGEHVTRLPLPTLYSLTIRAPQSEPGLSVSLMVELPPGQPSGRSRERGIPFTTGSDRSVLIDYLPAGDYSVHTWDPKGTIYNPVRITLPGAAELVLTPE